MMAVDILIFLDIIVCITVFYYSLQKQQSNLQKRIVMLWCLRGRAYYSIGWIVNKAFFCLATLTDLQVILTIITILVSLNARYASNKCVCNDTPILSRNYYISPIKMEDISV